MLANGPARLALEDLFAPLSRTEVLALLRERKLTLLRSGAGRHLAADAGWEALKALIARGEYPRGRGDIRVSKESENLPEGQWTKDGKLDAGKLEIHLARGYNVVITHLEPLVPSLGAICEEVRTCLHERSFAGVIVTTGADGAFRRHYDPEDLFIIQVEGSKRWQIFAPPVTHPIDGMRKPPVPDSAPVFDEVLREGDVLLLPGGNWHHCENGPGRSVHVGIFLIPPAPCHAIKALAAGLLEEELYRTPLTRLDQAGLLALEADIKKRLAEKIAEMKFEQFIEDWSTRSRQARG